MIIVVKRDGREVDFNYDRITKAVKSAMIAVNPQGNINGLPIEVAAVNVKDDVVYDIEKKLRDKVDKKITVEEIQDLVEEALIHLGFSEVARSYIRYRENRNRARNYKSDMMNIMREITFSSAVDADIKRENGNINADSPMGAMLKYGSEVSKQFTHQDLLTPEHSKAHIEGDIHIHDLDFYATGTETCNQIDIIKLFDGGFSTGHGYLREPGSIRSYAALACIAIQAEQNDQHGGQSIPNFDYGMAHGVHKSFKKAIVQKILDYLSIVANMSYSGLKAEIKADIDRYIQNGIPLNEYVAPENVNNNPARVIAIGNIIRKYTNADIDEITAFNILMSAVNSVIDETHQAMEAVIHNLNSMHSRAGAQVPFSSLNYGTDTTDAGRLVIRETLNAVMEGLGNGETAIFPISIFRVKDGVNANPGDPNYDLYRYSMEVTAKRLFPNYLFLDAPFNLQYYVEGKPETYVATMGCRTRVMGNVNGPEISHGRGNLSFTTINLPRLAIEAHGDIDKFFEGLSRMLKLAEDQLYLRYKYQCTKKVLNFPFLMGEALWHGSENLDYNDSVKDVLKHGTLSIGFIGLAEALVSLIGKHHGESAEAQELGLKIIGHMRKWCDDASQRHHLNYSLLSTPSEGLSGRFTRLDRKRYGIIPGVTDREYYTNSSHVPVYYPISAFDKIAIEAPYHALTNAGHIAYIEMDGDPSKNIDAIEQILSHMKHCGIGYGSINHPVDYDPVCGYTGIIDDVCPRCGRREGEPVSVDKLRHLGVWKHHAADPIAYRPDPNEEADRIPNIFVHTPEKENS